MALVAASSGVIVFPTVSTMSIVLLPAGLLAWSIQRGLRTGEWWTGLIAGLATYAYAFFSFSVTVFGLTVALALLVQLIARWDRLRNAIVVCVTALVVLACCQLAMQAVTGFDLFKCFRLAVAGHEAQQQSDPFRPAYMWWLRSTGNLLAYAFSVAPLLGVGFMLLLRRGVLSRPAAAWMLATTLALLIGSFGGLFWLETERIWIFFTPILAIAAAASIRSCTTGIEQRDTQLLLLIACVALTITFEAVFVPYL
ncbi:MAG: hypothetical protein QM770_02415 [Tepidisphaeraceae bacterium]